MAQKKNIPGNSVTLTPEEIRDLLAVDGEAPTPRDTHGENHPPAPLHTPDPEDDRAPEFFDNTPLQLSVEIGRCEILLKDLRRMEKGSLLELDRPAGAPLDLFVNSKLIARGELVTVGEKSAIRLTDIFGSHDPLDPCD